MKATAEAVQAAARLLDLAVKGRQGLRSNCRVTGRAMWQTMQRELSEAVRWETGNPRRFRVAQARFNSMTRTLDLEDSLDAAVEFWQGFLDGLMTNTMRGRSAKAYQVGYRTGSLEQTS